MRYTKNYLENKNSPEKVKKFLRKNIKKLSKKKIKILKNYLKREEKACEIMTSQIIESPLTKLAIFWLAMNNKSIIYKVGSYPHPTKIHIPKSKFAIVEIELLEIMLKIIQRANKINFEKEDGQRKLIYIVEKYIKGEDINEDIAVLQDTLDS